MKVQELYDTLRQVVEDGHGDTVVMVAINGSGQGRPILGVDTDDEPVILTASRQDTIGSPRDLNLPLQDRLPEPDEEPVS